MKSIKKIISTLLVFVLILVTVSCQKSEDIKSWSFTFVAFDTICSVQAYGTLPEEDQQIFKEAIISIADGFSSMFDRYDENSELAKINRRETDEFMITDKMAQIFSIAPSLYDWSNELFDISAGTLIDLWDVKNRTSLPTKEEIKEAKSHCGNFAYTIDWNVEPNSIKEHKITFYGDKKTIYDFGGLIKGYICDTLKGMFDETDGLKAVVINFGGNVMTWGKLDNRKDRAFNVGIAKPFEPGETVDIVKVRDRDVITSGVYERYFKVEGDDTIYSHIINPKTGYPVNNTLYSTTIISQVGLLGDYLSTACLLMDRNEANNLIIDCQDRFGDKNIQVIYVDNKNNVTKFPDKGIKTY